MKDKLNLRFSLIITLTFIIEIISLSNSEKDCPITFLKCKNSGICVDSYNKCPTPMSCSDDFKKVNQYTCSKINTYSEIIRCNGYTCWNNKCVTDANDCPTMISCPSGYQKCHDNSCVTDLDQCPKYITCPKFIPIRCPNGDCRRSLEDCPSLIKCPTNRPMLCNDNSCKTTANECLYSSINTKCNGKSMVRCSDGTCKSSKFLCSTQKSCPKNKVLCRFGICADSYLDCEKLEDKYGSTCDNSESKKVRCQDGSCREDMNNCPTDIICPVEKPVRCWDNSCKENILQCPSYQNCPKGFFDCPNGTCSLDLRCGTLFSCSWEAPFKCADNTCKRNPKDCVNSENCPLDVPVSCWDGTCVKNRNECIKPSNCDSATPVKCPDNSCRKNVEECREIIGCPIGFVICPDKSCKRKSDDCNVVKCPPNFPNLCKNGICVKEEKDCELENSCPSYSPFKCKKSSKCVSDLKECEEQKPPKNGKKTCPDGSIIAEGLICPLENSCTIKNPILCADNKCRTNCGISKCPKETPIKCLSGLCTNTISNCPSNYDFKRYENCSKLNMISCHNGQCAKYQEECKPTSACPLHMFLCENGKCVFDKDECPLETTCPKNFSFRCSNGTCEKSLDDCLNISGCPNSRSIKCSTNGYCVRDQQECKNYDKKFPMGNGCDNFKPYKCLSGECAFDRNDCKEEFCDPGKFYCSNSGVCENSKKDCKNSTCKNITCPGSGKCVDDYGDCLTSQNCKLTTPNRCLNGECRKFPFKFDSTNSDIIYCSKGIECPYYRPYLCADGSCKEKSSFCKSLTECPADKKIRCEDRTCVSRYEDCNTNISNISCPETNPILCTKTGNCVKNYFDCFDEKCPDLLPIKCSSGICVSSPRECIYKLTPITSPSKDLISITGCTGSQETCFDGTCRDKIEDCPLYNGCNNPKYPFKCKSGKCAKKESGCLKDINNNKIAFKELLEFDCGDGTELCNDGVCRKKCPITNSCDNNNPYLCSNGVCVKNINECAGESICSIGKPFKCADGTCMKNPSDCFKPKKLEPSTDLNLFVYPQNNLNADIVIDEYNNVIGSIIIPSNTFVEKNGNSTKQIISIKSIPTSFPYLTNTTKSFNDTVRDFILKLFPYGDQDDKNLLEFKYAIVSPVLLMDYHIKDFKIEQNIILKMSFDLSSVEKIGNITNRVCLAYLPKVNSTEWICKDPIKEQHNNIEENFYSGKVDEEGYYAIAVDIDFPKEAETEIKAFYRYFKWILLSIMLLFGLVCLLIYVLGRVWRYREKYKKTRKEFIEMEKKELFLKEKTTSFKGESIKDAELNMVFTDNSCKIDKLNRGDEEKNQRKQNLEALEDSYFIKIKKLEGNNMKLGTERDNLLERLDKLKEYQQLMNQGKSLLTDDSN